MNNFRRTAIASIINLTLLGAGNVYADDNSVLEKRIRELEKRLQQLDKASALSSPSITATTTPTITPEVEKLTRKVNTLERKLEVQDEVTTGNFKKLPTFDAGPDGYKITSNDKQHALRIGGSIQTDNRTFFNNPTTEKVGNIAVNLPAGPDSILIRQGRILLDGYAFKDINFRVQADFANANLLPDAYIDYTYKAPASLLVGKFKPSISLERLQGDSDTVFLERSFPSNLAPNRDVGIQLHGGFAMPGYQAEKVAGPIDAKNAFTYQIGVTDGAGDGANNTTDGLTNAATAALGASSAKLGGNKEFDARVFAQPFQHIGNKWLEGFGVGIAGSFGNPNHQSINKLTTANGQSQFVDYTRTINSSGVTQAATVGGVTSNGRTSRIYPQAYWYAGPIGLLGEYVASSQHLSSYTGGKGGANNVEQTNKAYQIQASYVVTGEDNAFTGIKPLRNFDPLKGGWGALQLAARWSELTVDSSTFQLLDPSLSARKASAWTIGANWFLNKNAIIRTDYENVSFTGGAGTTTAIANRPSESVFSTRFQLAF
jgi:phosphate-selective porin OprO/OprP